MRLCELIKLSLLVFFCSFSSLSAHALDDTRTIQTASPLTEYYESLENTPEKKAEEAAQEQREAAVRNSNNIYLVVLLLITAGFVGYLIRKSNKEEIMQGNQKFGIAVIISSALVILLSVMISDNWVYQFDFLQNLMSTLRIRFFEDGLTDKYEKAYFIDVPTKYVIFVCINAAAYGLTTYLGITPAPRGNVGK